MDSLWLDIPYTEWAQYFKFNKNTFPLEEVEELGKKLSDSGRKLVVITDPHISNSDTFSVHLSGNDVEE